MVNNWTYRNFKCNPGERKKPMPYNKWKIEEKSHDWEPSEKNVQENSPLNSWKNIVFSWKKIENIFWKYWNDTIKNWVLKVKSWIIISYSKVKKNFSFEIQEWELIFWDKKIEIENWKFSYDENERKLQNEDKSIILDCFIIKLNDRKISYKNWKGIEVKKRKKWIKWLVSRVKENILNIRN